MQGEIHGTPMPVTVDPSATHNFISTTIMQCINLPITSSKTFFGMSLGTKEVGQGEGKCKQVSLQLQHIEVLHDYLPLSLANSDLFLGIQWLEKLGIISTN